VSNIEKLAPVTSLVSVYHLRA